MTLDYCGVSNWSVGNWSFSVHYKSLVIGFLRWSAPTVEPAELWEEPACVCVWRGHLTLPERPRYVCPAGLFSTPLKKRRGRPAKSAVDHQTSQCVKLLSSKLANLSGIRPAAAKSL